MDIHMSSKSKGTDKLDGEFHVPLSYGAGNSKSKLAACVECCGVVSLSINSKGFICSDCGEYNGDMKACIKKLDEAEFKSQGTHIQTDGMKKYMALRDTMQIKADMYAGGITRKGLGSQRYQKELSRRLRDNNVRQFPN